MTQPDSRAADGFSYSRAYFEELVDSALGHAKNRVGDDRCRQFKTITQNVDHFGFVNMDKYEQRYTLNVDQWQSGKPIFFYAGNEGDIDLFCDNTGFSRCLAERGTFVVSSSSF